jgi:hypothetical protein
MGLGSAGIGSMTTPFSNMIGGDHHYVGISAAFREIFEFQDLQSAYWESHHESHWGSSLGG